MKISFRKEWAAFALLAFLSLQAFSDTSSGEWKEISLPAALLESRLARCNQDSTHRRACDRAIAYLEQRLGAPAAPGGTPLEKFEAIRNAFSKKEAVEAEWVAGAMNEWLAAFDFHAQLTTASQSDEQAQSSFINVRGIGAKLRLYRARALVAYVVEGSGAEEAGLRPGDELLRINGARIASAGRQEQERILRAAKPPYLLKVRRNGRALSLEAGEKRFQLPNVETKSLPDGTAVVRVRSFVKDSTCSEVRHAIASLAKRGNVTKISIDLRDNPGGLVREAQCTAGLFLGSGLLFAKMKRSRLGDLKLVPASPAGFSHANDPEFALFTEEEQETDLPVEIRINQNTASAAEMFAAALQDARRARIIGSRSFGKGSMQSIFHPWDDPRLYLARTTHLIVRPSGKSLNLAGVQPDIVTERAEGANFPRERELSAY